MTKNNKIAIIDLGSNSVRMVVYDNPNRAMMPIFNEKAVCALARGLEQTGRLNPKGVIQARSAFRRYLKLCELMKVNEISIMATAAVREASDGAEFVSELESLHHVKINTISGEDEAKYAGMGVLYSIANANGIVADLGGGSLEIIAINNSELKNPVSLPLGHFRLIEVANNNIQNAETIMGRSLSELAVLSLNSGANLYAVGGGFRSLAKVHMSKHNYPLRILHNYEVLSESMLELCNFISRRTPEQLRKIAGLNNDRIETIAYTSSVMASLINVMRPAKIIFSAYGLREGAISESIDESSSGVSARMLQSCKDIASRSGEDVEYSNNLYQWLKDIFPETFVKRDILQAITSLSEVSWAEHPEYRHEIAFKKVLEAPAVGLTHKERVFMAISCYHRYKTKFDDKSFGFIKEILSDDEIKKAKAIGMAMSLAANLSGTSVEGLKSTSLSIKKNVLELHLNQDVEMLIAEVIDKKLEKLADSLSIKYRIS